jgi:hypothetical protein
MANLRCAKPATALNGEPASKVERLGGAFDLKNSIFKGPSQADSRRLIPATSQIQVVHHYSAAGVRSWHVVLTEDASRKSVAAFASKHEAIGQLGFFSEKLRAKIVGRGAPQ